MRYQHISVAVPMLAELDNLPRLLHNLGRQTCRDFKAYFCVNNPASWATSADKREHSLFEENQETLRLLEAQQGSLNFQFSTLNFQWQGKRQGVGWARKMLFDSIAHEQADNELIVSLDADTLFQDNYLETVLQTMNSHPDHSALSVPYYHPLNGDDTTDRAMLRYEIYMRHYLISLSAPNAEIPYTFTALGSAMAFPVWAYRRVGGITPLQAGEDFYLMQKFAKTGRIMNAPAAIQTSNSQIPQPIDLNGIVRNLDINAPGKHGLDSHGHFPIVFPSARPSQRVPFGTGPAIAHGLDLMDESYPLYPHEAFKAVADTYALFPFLYDHDAETPMTHFLRQQLKTDDLWGPLRKNFKSRELFVHACSERVDGLRILQFLRTYTPRPAEEELALFCHHHSIPLPNPFSFRRSSIEELNTLRNNLFHLENSVRH